MQASLSEPLDEVEFLCRLNEGTHAVVRKPPGGQPRELYVNGSWQEVIRDYIPPQSTDRLVVGQDRLFRFGDDVTMNGDPIDRLDPRNYRIRFEPGHSVSVEPL